MKKCPYCGQEYPDEYSVCTIDENPLESTNPKPSTPKSEHPAGTTANDKGKIGEDYEFLVQIVEEVTAANLLEKFEKSNIRFQLEKVFKEQKFRPGGVWSTPYLLNIWALNIYVHKDDKKSAASICFMCQIMV